MRRLLLCLVGAAMIAPASAGAQSIAEPVDCTGPARAAQPGSDAWHQREAENAYCATQRNRDTKSSPLYLAANAQRPPSRATTAMDPLREPTLHAGRRFRFDELSITGAEGKAYPAMLFRPCDSSCTDMPSGLESVRPPYPGVVIMHGGAATQEMYWWAAEGLAAAGYMALAVNSGGTDNGHYRAVEE